mmetsp:Transcript_7548/g.10987  ORF Transcript_7548/g.10987 Transcript_7548/m.10987 type:complete len:1119 (+) Transcript_7548:40-3396(+)|eukprot:CAMPEP_0194201854 /NCGR_PEP_ID=MMETSP0156-20130528/2019_1 /TAXON_ID=33649 /ORGANISM="Thalassionema nitzschioides, Strain L26-B" /LENGTH=1118 /DNA_ID=CAMNT_0038927157 /DNA_START=32 /DNA_END=3388 /DNA_ORIENTATION=+
MFRRFIAIAASLLLFVVTNEVAVDAQADTCPPPYQISPNAVGDDLYSSARDSCTDKCNAAGYCCTLGYGGCNTVPCNVGCHIAFFSADLDDCKAECDVANDGEVNSCSYSHLRHSDTGHLEFDPEWVSSGGEAGVRKCGGSVRCGCSVEGDWGAGLESYEGDCSAEACYKGCELAFLEPESNYHGNDVPYDRRLNLDATALNDSIVALKNHVTGNTLTQSEITTQKEAFLANGGLLSVQYSLLDGALDLIDTYENDKGPLFLNSQTVGGFPRESSTDGKELERAMLAIQQEVLDQVYHGSTKYIPDLENSPYPSIIEECSDYLNGRSWETSNFFPGGVANLPTGYEGILHSSTIDATMNACWGRPVAYCESSTIRPLGWHLVAGGIATITVPQNFVDIPGFKVQIGAHVVNNNNKNTHRRMDRVTSTYDITNTTIKVASPLGGGIYIRVPYLADAGTVTITAIGGVIKSTLFQNTTGVETSSQEWSAQQSSTTIAPWTDLETSNFLLQVPHAWMHGYDYAHFQTLADDYIKSMNGVSELLGIPIENRNHYVLYVQPDLHIRHHAYGIGFPQVNEEITADLNGPQGNGLSNHWMVTQPERSHICYHELGHAQLFSKFAGEEEAVVNFLYVYVNNVKFGVDLDQAFMDSFTTGDYTIDKAAIHWMITDNFRNGNEMDTTNSEYNEMRYQHRGYAKYAELARMYGWSMLSDFWGEEHRQHMLGNTIIKNDSDPDDRIFRLSVAAGEDITPLIHFYGIHPANPSALKTSLENAGLFPSETLRQHLVDYAALVPFTRQDFINHFNEVYPGKKDCNCCESPNYGCGWYNANYNDWDETKAAATIDSLRNILNLYYPASQYPTSKFFCTAEIVTSTFCDESLYPSWDSNCNRKCNGRGKTCKGVVCATAPSLPSPTPPPTLPPPTPTTPQPEPTPVDNPSCLADNAQCRGISNPCCGYCHKNGRCKGSRRDLSKEHPVFGNNPSLRNHPVFDAFGNPPGLDRAEVLATVRYAKEKWTGADYKFTYQGDISDPFPGPFDVEVKGGEVVSVVHANNGNPVDSENFYGMPTIPEFLEQFAADVSSDILNAELELDSQGLPKKSVVARMDVAGQLGGMKFQYIRNIKKN